MGADSPSKRSLIDVPTHLLAVLASLVCLAIGGFLSWHHPLDPALAIVAFVLWSTAVFLRPVAWLFVVPALLPVIDLAQWTGWLVVEEFDILVLGAATGAYASIAWRGGVRITAATAPNAVDAAGTSAGTALAEPGLRATRLSGVSAMLIGLFGVSTLVALYRGISAAGTMDFGWFDGYYDTANSLRIAKSFLLALVMLPPLLAGIRCYGRRAIGALAAGLTAGLCLASLAVLWERVAFPGLLNFSSDYRVTGPFWEMHVGGAALDGFLALTLPFAIMEILTLSSRNRWFLAGGTLLVAGYACLVTFSRGVFLAVPVSLMLLALLLARRGHSWSPQTAARTLGKGCLLAIVMAAMSYLSFRFGGYRALLAALGVFAITLRLGASGLTLPVAGWFAALGAGVLAGAAGVVIASAVPKGVYVVFALAFAACAVSVLRLQRTGSLPATIVAFGAYVWLNIAAAGVALGWGGVRAFQDTAIILSILMALTIWKSRASSLPWPRNLRMQATLLGMAALAALTAAVFSGGAYMSDRFASSERDAAGRLQHWRDGIGLLRTPAQWLLGMGAGRFPENFMYNLSDREFPGSSRVAELAGEHYLVLSGPRREGSFGEVFRVAQRLQVAPGGQYSIVIDARAFDAAQVHVELCQRHLLYVDGCAIAKIQVPAGDGSWHRFVTQLDGANLGDWPWYAPRPTFFAMATESPLTRVDIANISLIGPDGAELLANRHFAYGMSNWFTVSDRLHLPWHIKNLGLNVLFDQGIAGLLLFLMLTGGALFRLVAGAARAQPMAPFVAAALTGFLMVGLFDSLLDVPRLAFLFYVLTFIGLALPRGVAMVEAGRSFGTNSAHDRHSSGKSAPAAEDAKIGL
jgi:hypothetical protein